MEDKKMPLNKFYNVAVDVPKGDLSLLEKVMEGANSKVDERLPVEERKGGAGNLGKMFYSVGEDNLAIMCHVPKISIHKKLSLADWVMAVAAGIANLGKMFYSVGEDKLAIMCHVPKIGIHKKLSLEDWVMAVAASIAPVTIVEVGESSPKLKPVRWTSTASGPR
eukprot:gene7236-345_t